MLRIDFLLRIPLQGIFVTIWILTSAHLALSDEPLVLQPDKDGVQRATIKMESYAFTPKKLIVEQGKPVELTLQNDSFLVPHNFLLDSPEGERLVEENISSGETETVQFTLMTPGTYSFYCDKQFLFFPNHREEGMEGTIIVR
jgi:plastocyanin